MVFNKILEYVSFHWLIGHYNGFLVVKATGISIRYIYHVCKIGVMLSAAYILTEHAVIKCKLCNVLIIAIDGVKLQLFLTRADIRVRTCTLCIYIYVCI